MTTEQYNEAVTRAYKAAHAALFEQLKEFDGKKKWLLFSRAVNILFQGHYGMSFIEADKKVNAVEQPRSDEGK